MSDQPSILILPYTLIVGQEQLKLALELAYIAPQIGGVLISGERGTGKSTIVRAFAQMIARSDSYDGLPVTIPINATEDRVVGGWKIQELMQGEAKTEPGLLEEADGRLLYVDEVNLLDDHIVNLILDVTSTGVLVVQREGRRSQQEIHFTLVGTMNPEEGGLRPQLLDRFGLMVQVKAELDTELRYQILQTMLAFDAAKHQRKNGQSESFIETALHDVQEYRKKLEQARQDFSSVQISESLLKDCVNVARGLKAEGHRGDYILSVAACAYAAREGQKDVTVEHVKKVVPIVLQHRRTEAKQLNRDLWGDEEEQQLIELITHV